MINFDTMAVRFKTYKDAETAIDELKYLVDEKGYATVRDFKEQGAFDGDISEEDVLYGWRDVDTAMIPGSVSTNCYIRLPRPERLVNIYKGDN